MHRRLGVHQRPAPPPKYLSKRSRKSSGLLRQALRNRWEILKSLQEHAEPVRIPHIVALIETNRAEYPLSPSCKNQSSDDAFQSQLPNPLTRRAAASADTEPERREDSVHRRPDIVRITEHRVSRCDRSRVELHVLWPHHATSWEPERELQINAPNEWLAYTSGVEHRACLGEHQRDKWHVLAIHSHWVAIAQESRRRDRKVILRVSWEGSTERTDITERSARLRNPAMVAEYWHNQGGRDVALLDADIREA
ncbi:hypothetical protein CABS03_10662 [Colletotrichum abscissum]|uniref:Chromo domain-containing protein n=1 Tax=Colletotrichum abscissum TaxID=1671311 RepID=A0A9P9X1W8_9PEZI|nr:hypothetical protein CABS02_13988 [Colletotrichum abscissum]